MQRTLIIDLSEAQIKDGEKLTVSFKHVYLILCTRSDIRQFGFDMHLKQSNDRSCRRFLYFSFFRLTIFLLKFPDDQPLTKNKTKKKKKQNKKKKQ